MKRLERNVAAWVMLVAAVAACQTGQAPKQHQAKTNSTTGQTGTDDRGQQVFHQNCSRCHNAPEGFPASVSGAIAKHMRVRAGLSEPDYKALLKFLKP